MTNRAKYEMYNITEGRYNILLQRKLKGNWTISSNREDSTITLDLLSGSRVFVLAGPREKFTENEMNHLKKYLETGGNLLVLLGKDSFQVFEARQTFYPIFRRRWREAL